MAMNIPAVNITSSPPSGGTRTYHGTPSTIPTVMSPEVGNDSVDNGASIPKLELANSSALATRRNLLVAPVAIPTHLSPTAEDFTPSADTTTFPATVRNARFDQKANAPRNFGVIGQALTARAHTVQSVVPVVPVIKFGVFTTEDSTTRTFVVSGVRGLTAAALSEYVAVSYRNFKSIANINGRDLHNGIFSVEFYDHDEARQALYLTANFIFAGQNLQFHRILPIETARHNMDPTLGVSNHAGEYIVSIVDVGAHLSAVNAQNIFDACSGCGRVKAFHTYQTLPGAVMSFRVEWVDTRANATIMSMAVLSGYRITITSYTPDVPVTGPMTTLSRPSPLYDNDECTRNVMAFLQPELSARGTAGANHNVVEIAKIVMGQDVRTTIMLRNIPNRVDQPNLKKLLDETSKGKYDFMYLRIDFANNCNVGYAFINFVDPLAIVDFAKARAGQKWNLFQSDKIAEISYATIQGRDCLIQKFRNSSVMLEQKAFRPKLYTTGDSPDAGDEEPFPVADNHAKLKRSLDNAEHVGLYAPREGQAYRERQRRQYSQYDRGTPGAESELAGFPGHLNSVTPRNFSAPSCGSGNFDSTYKSASLGLSQNEARYCGRKALSVQPPTVDRPYNISDYVAQSFQRPSF